MFFGRWKTRRLCTSLGSRLCCTGSLWFRVAELEISLARGYCGSIYFQLNSSNWTATPVKVHLIVSGGSRLLYTRPSTVTRLLLLQSNRLYQVCRLPSLSDQPSPSFSTTRALLPSASHSLIRPTLTSSTSLDSASFSRIGHSTQAVHSFPLLFAPPASHQRLGLSHFFLRLCPSFLHAQPADLLLPTSARRAALASVQRFVPVQPFSHSRPYSEQHARCADCRLFLFSRNAPLSRRLMLLSSLAAPSSLALRSFHSRICLSAVFMSSSTMTTPAVACSKH